MKTTVLNYRVIVEKEFYANKERVYVTQVPTLGISDYGSSIEEALNNTEKLIKFHIESLIEEEGIIPAPDDPKRIIVTTQEVIIHPKKKFSFS